MGIEYSVHLPSEFICTQVHRLLPDWLAPVFSVLIVLQQCQASLRDRTPETETHKQRLRAEFIAMGHQIAQKLQQMGYLAEMFDPRTGLPILSQPGSVALDDVAVVQATLGYPLTQTGGCWIIDHPNWGTAVFPSVLVSSAMPETVAAVTQEVLANH